MKIKEPYKILIVEDEPSMRNALVDSLRKLNYKTIVANNGFEAVTKFKLQKPDLVLLDIILPEKNGLDVLEEIRINLKSLTPVVILSNLESQQDVETAKNLGVTQFLLKSNISLRKLGITINGIFQTQLK